MRLLRYSQTLNGGKVSGSCLSDDIIIAAGLSTIVCFASQQLVNCALGKQDAKQVEKLFHMQVPVASDDQIYDVVATNDRMFVVLERSVYLADHWREKRDASVFVKFCEFEAPACITDVKLDPSTSLLFVLVNVSPEENSVTLWDSRAGENLGQIGLGQSKPLTAVLDPKSQIFTVICADRNISVFQYDHTGSYRLIHKLNHYVQVDPLRYKITMSPQSDRLPILNSMSTSGTPAILLLDRQQQFKIESTLVGHFDKCHIFKYSPKIYRKTTKSGAKITYNLAASADFESGSVVIWNTKRLKPLLNTKCAQDSYVTDLQWGSDGLSLIVFTSNGQMIIFAFRQDELGEIISDAELEKLRAAINFLPPLPPAQSALEQITENAEKVQVASAGSNAKVGKKKVAPTTLQSTSMEFNMPSYSVPKDLKRKPKDPSQPSNGKKQKHDLEPMDFLDTSLLMPGVSFSKMRLATPKIRLTFSYTANISDNMILTVKNGSGNEQTPSVISLKQTEFGHEKTLFEEFLPKLITMCTSGKSFWSCCSEDGIIYVFSDLGKRLLPPLIMGVPCSFLEGCGDFLLCVTSTGQMYCWNLENSKLHFPPSSVYPLLNPSLRFSDDVLTRAENITLCAITANGVPIITLSNGDGYMFDKEMETWMLINDTWWAYGSQYWDMTETTTSGAYLNESNGKHEKKDQSWNSRAQGLTEKLKGNRASILNYLEKKTNDELNRKGRARNIQKFAKTILMKEGFENLEDSVTLSHLENKLLILLRLGENEEFVSLIVIYCIRLSEMGYKGRLETVLQWLYNDGDYKNLKVANVSAEDLLKKILVACAEIRLVQRVTTSYAAAIGLINDSL
ncbi:LADA_0A02278g1_1 [Lachancea dasiensis]|uniref:Protein HIR n=1 Tax=Lachancea dasiensis TaxID=1072105 RepID=A0A1G4IMW4_9SACH|nr:LADA_0A02278g1_1 [Lachancea dasiensis]